MKNKKTITTIGNILQISSLAIFASSFFVEDNKKAVNRRYFSLATFGAGYGIFLYGKVAKK